MLGRQRMELVRAMCPQKAILSREHLPGVRRQGPDMKCKLSVLGWVNNGRQARQGDVRTVSSTVALQLLQTLVFICTAPLGPFPFHRFLLDQCAEYTTLC